jgi:hypothetical protein
MRTFGKKKAEGNVLFLFFPSHPEDDAAGFPGSDMHTGLSRIPAMKTAIRVKMWQ